MISPNESKRFHLVKCFALNFACATFALAQVNTATIVGTISDTSGSVIQGVQVTARHAATGATHSTRSDDGGNYIFDRLNIGDYVISASQAGFKTVERQRIHLDATGRVKVDLTLQVGAITENVSVQTDAPLVSTQSTELGVVVNETRVRNLPLNGRNFSELISLETGTVQTSDGVFFNGLTRDGVNVSVDGTDASNPDRPSTADFGNQTNQNLLSVEVVAEFKTTTGTFSAETGRALSGAVNVITKSGTNELHGSVYEFFRNDKLDSRNFFAPTRDILRQNQFGATVGGPILRNKLFFFAGWEGVRIRRGVQITGQVPTDSLRAQIRAQTPGLIPFLDTLPPANIPTGDPNIGFHRRSDGNSNREDSGTARLDYNPTGKDTIFLRYSILDAFSVAAQLQPTDGQTYPTQDRSGTASWTHVLTPRSINEIRLGASKQDLPRTSGAFTPYGIPGLRGLITTDVVKFLRANGGSWTILDNVTNNFGRHSIKAGFERRRFHNGRSQYQNDIYTVNTVSDLIAGRFTQALISLGTDTRRMQESHWGLYVQDDFRVTPRLTLNLGLRYEYFTPTQERDNFLFNVVSDPYGPYRKAGEPIFDPDKNNFGPRFGFAWDIGGNSKNVIRGGMGVYYSPIANRNMSTMISPPELPAQITVAGSQTNLRMPLDDRAILGNLSAFPLPVGRLEYDPHARNSYSVQWSFNYQRALAKDLALETGYIANRGLKLQELNFLNDLEPALGYRRGHPEFGRIQYLENSDMSVYHSLQITLRKRFSRGLQFNTHYTYGKNLTIGGVDQHTQARNDRVQDPENHAGSRGRSDADLQHVLRLDYAWDIPLASWIGAGSGPAKALSSGWQIMGITSVRSGFPMFITSGRDNRGNGDSGNQRPDAVVGVDALAGGYRDSSSHTFLNAAAFSDPCTSRGLKSPCGLFGNLGKNVLSGPGFANFDVSLFKNTRLTDRLTLQFRTEFFNLLNHANFMNPSATELQISSRSFGQITSASIPREIQFALKLLF